LKQVDKWVGLLVCALLSLVWPIMRRNGRCGETKKILVIKFWGIGSLTMVSYLLRSLKRENPGAEIHLLTLEANAEFARAFGLADDVLTLRLDKHPLRLIRSISNTALEVMRGDYDVVIDLEYLTRITAILTALTRAPIRSGFHAANFWRGPFHNRRVPFTVTRHVRDNFLAVGREAGFTLSTETYVRLQLVDEFSNDTSDKIESFFALEERYIVINANAGETALERRWPKEHFIDLIENLIKETEKTIVLIGGANEREYCELISSAVGEAGQSESDSRIINLAGKTTIVELARVLEHADLVISNDSGPAHMADHLGAPTIVLFGPETPALWGPLGEQSRTIYRHISCSPCINVHNMKTVMCLRDGAECLTEIMPDTVFAHAQEIISSSTLRGPARAGVTGK